MSLPRYGDNGQTKTVPQKNHGQPYFNMRGISDLKENAAPKILDSLNKMMQRITNENAVGSINIMIVM